VRFLELNMSDNRINMPSGFGGLMRYDEETKSRFILSPMQVVTLIIVLIIFVIGLKIFFPLSG
jgi:preprotein translocase subunit Sec61beta